MVLRSMPASRRRKLRVPSTNSKGKPAAKPSASMRRLAGWPYTFSVSHHFTGATAVAGLDVSFMAPIVKGLHSSTPPWLEAS